MKKVVCNSTTSACAPFWRQSSYYGARQPVFHNDMRLYPGADNDPAHLQLAESAKLTQGGANVEFLLLDFVQESERLERESFDFVWTQRACMLPCLHALSR